MRLLSASNADSVILWQGTAAWVDLEITLRESLPSLPMPTDTPDVAAAKAHRRAGAEFLLELLTLAPRQPRPDPEGRAQTPLGWKPIDMSDHPEGVEQP